MAITRMSAIKEFFSKDSARPVDNKEMIELKKGIPEDEFNNMAVAAAAALGQELEAKA